ncbi:MAG: hypothetical protein IOD09_15185 [Rhodocyclaceae bacterium]|nr:hypothetical protein [Rhodocyclaceae bacterium]MCA4904701.1 hypothetical protein [Rhodocyclaceae bacterium]
MRPAFVRLRDAHHRRRLHTGVLATALLALGGCVSIPTGPSVATFPGTGRSFDQFRADEADCRRYASDSIGGSDPSRAQANSAVTSAAVGTAVGALAGAALGGSQGAAAGAGVGLLFGGVAGVDAANTSGYGIQQRYDNAFVQCMYAKGNKVPSTGLARSSAPVAPARPPAPAVYAPPPPPKATVYGPPVGYDPRFPPPPPPPPRN